MQESKRVFETHCKLGECDDVFSPLLPPAVYFIHLVTQALTGEQLGIWRC